MLNACSNNFNNFNTVLKIHHSSCYYFRLKSKLLKVVASSAVISRIAKITVGPTWINFTTEIPMFDNSSRKKRYLSRYSFHTPTSRGWSRASNFVERNRQGSNFVERARHGSQDRVAGARGAPAATRSPYYLLKSRLPSHHLSTPRTLSVFARLHLQIEYSREYSARAFVHAAFRECPTTYLNCVHSLRLHRLIRHTLEIG